MTPASRNASQPWCFFRCGGSGYAVRLDTVAEVVEVDRLVPIPLRPGRVLGLCALRRELIPVVGLDTRHPEPPSPGRLTVLVLRTTGGLWSVRIDAEGTAVADGVPDPSAITEDDAGPSFVGTILRGGTGHAALDPEATWRKVRQGVETAYGREPGADTAERARA